MKKKVEIWGTYPPPIGGVSIHIKRLFERISESYFGANVILKSFHGTYSDRNRNIYKVNFKFWEFLQLLFISKRILHIHTARWHAWLFILIFGFKHSLILTLHNQKFKEKQNIFKFLISKCFLKKANYILVNDGDYRDFLINMFQLNSAKLKIVSAYIPPLDVEFKGLPDKISRFIKDRKFVISANGSGVKIRNGRDLYGLDVLVDIIFKLKDEIPGIGLVYLLPQIGNKEYFDSIFEKIRFNNLEENILIFQEQISNGFEIWAKSDLFIRPTQTDIEGISVKEALSFGIPVIASNVCTRPKESILYQEGDANELLKKVLDINRKPVHVEYSGEEAFVEIMNLYKSLL